MPGFYHIGRDAADDQGHKVLCRQRKGRQFFNDGHDDGHIARLAPAAPLVAHADGYDVGLAQQDAGVVGFGLQGFDYHFDSLLKSIGAASRPER